MLTWRARRFQHGSTGCECRYSPLENVPWPWDGLDFVFPCKRTCTMWSDRRLTDLFGIEHPIVLAPMAGAMDATLAIAVAQGGGLGSLPAALLNADQLREQAETFRAQAPGKPLSL